MNNPSRPRPATGRQKVWLGSLGIWYGTAFSVLYPKLHVLILELVLGQVECYEVPCLPTHDVFEITLGVKSTLRL